MTINVSKKIQIDPNNADNKATVKQIAQKALFAAPAGSMTRDDAWRLYNMISKADGELSIESGDVDKIKSAVDRTWMRGVSWQFAQAVDPIDREHKTTKTK